MTLEEIKIRETLAVTHGGRITGALMDALYRRGIELAFVDRNGNVDIDIDMIDAALNDPEVRGELRSAVYKALPYVSDQITYEKRQKWSRDRELERRVANDYVSELL